jgi:AraC-like DNA-binding protein
MVSAIQLGNLFEYTRHLGIDECELRALLKDKNIDVCNENIVISEAEFLEIFNAAFMRSNDPYFGLHYGCFLNIRALGFICKLSLSAVGIEQAVLMLQEYLKAFFSLVTLVDHHNKNKYTIELKANFNNEALKAAILDMVFCFIYRELRLMINDDQNLELKMHCRSVTEYEILLNTEIKKSSSYKITLYSNVKNLEINKRKVADIEVLLPKFLRMMDKKPNQSMELSWRVRTMILHMCKPELPTFSQVASQFALSERSLQRRLLNEGNSFRNIADEIKKELAIYLSKGGKLKTQDIAFILGYSSASAYLHASKKWRMKL